MNYREGITLASALLITSLMLSGCGNFKCASEWRTVVHEWEAIARGWETIARAAEAKTRFAKFSFLSFFTHFHEGSALEQVLNTNASEWEAVASKASVRASEARTKTRALRSNE